MTMYIDSQEGTTLEQSQRLLKLGLNPSTADMFWYEDFVRTYDGEPIEGWVLSIGFHPDGIPAWSFHRLLEILDEDFRIDQENIDEAFLRIITRIKVAINDGMINSKYLIDEVPDTSDKALYEL